MALPRISTREEWLAARLELLEAARLAVMLPRPKFFERAPQSGYLQGRAATIAQRMGDAALP